MAYRFIFAFSVIALLASSPVRAEVDHSKAMPEFTKFMKITLKAHKKYSSGGISGACQKGKWLRKTTPRSKKGSMCHPLMNGSLVMLACDGLGDFNKSKCFSKALENMNDDDDSTMIPNDSSDASMKTRKKFAIELLKGNLGNRISLKSTRALAYSVKAGEPLDFTRELKKPCALFRAEKSTFQKISKDFAGVMKTYCDRYYEVGKQFPQILK